MANKSFLLGISFLVGFCYVIYLAYDSNTKLRAARERADYAKHEYETLSVQVQQLLDQKAKLEKQLQSERNELRKVKEDKDYIEQQRKDLFSKLQDFTQTEKTLKAQQADLKQALEVANRELADLRAEKANADQRNQAEFAQLGTQKELEITKLRDQLADLKRKYEEARANAAPKPAKSTLKRQAKVPAQPKKVETEDSADAAPANIQPPAEDTQRKDTQNENTETRGSKKDVVANENNPSETQPETPETAKRGKGNAANRKTNTRSKEEPAPKKETENEEEPANENPENGESQNQNQNQNQQLPNQVQPPVNAPEQQQQKQLNPPVPVNDPNVDKVPDDNNNQQEPPPVDEPAKEPVNNDDAEGEVGPNDDTKQDGEFDAARSDEKAQNQANQEAEELHNNLGEVDDENEESQGRLNRRRRSN